MVGRHWTEHLVECSVHNLDFLVRFIITSETA